MPEKIEATPDESVLIVQIIIEMLKNSTKTQAPEVTNENMLVFIREFGNKRYDEGVVNALGKNL